MFDSVDASAIPPGAEVVAGYIDGRWRWSAADWSRFPLARKLTIATSAATDDGQCLDVERYDATPDQGSAWCQRRRAAGVVPWEYCAWANWPACRQAFATAKVPEPWWWIADWTGAAVLLDGAVGHQYANLPGYDLSVVEDSIPGFDDVQPAPLPGPLPEGIRMASAIELFTAPGGTLPSFVFTEDNQGHLGQWVAPSASQSGKWEYYDLTVAVQNAGGTPPTLAS